MGSLDFVSSSKGLKVCRFLELKWLSEALGTDRQGLQIYQVTASSYH
jgi:hypothetical protein